MKKTMKVLVVSGLLSTLFLGSSALAATISNSTATFKEDPIGPLRVENVTDIQFGDIYTSGDKATYDAIYVAGDEFTPHSGTKKFAPLNITTVDSRGTNDGWQLQAKMDGAFKTADNDSIPNATLTLEATEFASTTPSDERVAPSVKSGRIELSATGSAVTVASAKSGEGIGTWTTLFGDQMDDIGTVTAPKRNNKVQLTVPGGNNIKENKEYSTTVVWTLLNTPVTP